MFFWVEALRQSRLFSQNRFGVLPPEPYVCEAGQMVGLWHYVSHQESTAQ